MADSDYLLYDDLPNRSNYGTDTDNLAHAGATGRAIRAQFSVVGALIVSNQRRALRAPRCDRSFGGPGSALFAQVNPKSPAACGPAMVPDPGVFVCATNLTIALTPARSRSIASLASVWLG
jgi:hypothetical protein